MNPLARIMNYLLPVSEGPPVRDHRAEARACAEANRQAASQLIQAERDYWTAFYKRATTQEERWTAIEELSQLDALRAPQRT